MDEQFHDALGIALPRWRALSASVRADLDRGAKGVKWWTGLEESQRQQISHQLAESLATVPGLLARARVHLLEVAHAAELLNAAPHCVVVQEGGTGEPRQVPLRYESAAEHLPSELEQLHIGGVVHALFSALDVVGAVIIGVAGLPRSILKADFGVAMSALENPKNALPGQRETWLQLHQEISAALATPADWHLWLGDLRNMVAHRAKIPTLHLVLPNGRAALSGGDIVRFVNIETRLPRQPARAFLQSLTANPHEVYLDEPAVVTLTGVVDSTVRLVELVSDALAKLWERRRARDLQFDQPPEQWPKPEPAPARSFPGFAPGPPLTGDLQWTTSSGSFSAMDGAGVGKRSCPSL